MCKPMRQTYRHKKTVAQLSTSSATVTMFNLKKFRNQ